MDKAEIITWIRQYAADHDGRAPGKAQLRHATGLGDSSWAGRHWVTWSEALAEAGLQPNVMQQPHLEDHLLRSLATLTRDLGRYPAHAEIKMRRRSDPDFPSAHSFDRLGDKPAKIRRLADWCTTTPGWDDVADLLGHHAPGPETEEPTSAPTTIGVVYLAKMGRHYKIGQTRSLGRREYELNLQLPERLTLIHALETDDPLGIERYWHERFAAKRTNGEWFTLAPADVAAFRRRGRSM